MKEKKKNQQQQQQPQQQQRESKKYIQKVAKGIKIDIVFAS